MTNFKYRPETQEEIVERIHIIVALSNFKHRGETGANTYEIAKLIADEFTLTSKDKPTPGPCDA